MEPSPIKVLVVDDDVDTAEVTAELLSLHGFMVEVARSGEAGISLGVGFHPDVVILDLAMPVIDGFSVASTLLGTVDARHTKFIAYTGYSCGSVYREALAGAFDRVIAKPAPVEVLVEAISDIAKQRFMG